MTPRIAIPVPKSDDPEYSNRAWPEYAEAVTRSGGEPVQIPLTLSNSEIAQLASTCQGILLPGSAADVNPQKFGQQPAPETAPTDHARENVDELLLQDAHNLHKPILGICFGTQMLNVWRTGSLLQHVEGTGTDHQPGRAVLDAHAVTIAADSMLGQMIHDTEATEQNHQLTLQVNSSHHQAIDNPGDRLRVVARSTNDGIIEAIEGGQQPNHFVLAVQWHPERTYDHSAASRAIFDRFIAEARVWKPREVAASVA